jgi:hypothetical protein
MTHTTTMQKAAGATNSNGQHTNTNSENFRTDEAIQQAHDGKAIAAPLAGITKAGHAVHEGSAFIETLAYWLIQSTPYAAAILFGIFLGVTW